MLAKNQKEMILKRYSEGIIVKDIAREMGLEYHIVSAYLTKNGHCNRKKRYKISEAKQKEIINLYENGKKIGTIARMFNIPSSRVRVIIPNPPKPNQKRKLSDSQIKDIQKRYYSGESAPEIAKSMGLSPSTIWKHTDSSKKPKKFQKRIFKITDEQVKEIQSKHKEGYSVTRLARIYDVTPATIYYHLGVSVQKRRNPSEMKETVLNEWQNGIPVKEISKKHRLSVPTIMNLIGRTYGLKGAKKC